MKQAFITILLMLLPMLASAETVEIDGIWYNLVSKIKEAKVTKDPSASQYSGNYSGSITIPNEVTYNNITYRVTSIEEYAFYGCPGLTSINIGDNVTNIANFSFSNCRSLTSINIGISVTDIGLYAFAHCTALTSVSIPNNVKRIESNAFDECSLLNTLIIGNGVDYMGTAIFQNCKSLTSVTLGKSLTSISSATFINCSGLTSVTIPNSVTSIVDNAFSGCCGLTSVTIPNSVTSIDYNAFYGCIGLTSITIPNSVTSIGKFAFAKCDELTDVYCQAEILSESDSWEHEGLHTDPDAFKDTYPQTMTLHVPAASVEAYRSTEPWSQFKAFVALEDGDTPTTLKCATPEINYADGKVSFSCETEGVDFISEVTVADAKKYYDSEFNLSQTYKITVYAVKTGYENSDVATREIIIENSQSSLFGDLNKDGKVNVADHVDLSKIILNQ